MQYINNKYLEESYFSSFDTGSVIETEIILDRAGPYALTIQKVEIISIYDIRVTYVLTKDTTMGDPIPLNRNHVFSRYRSARDRFKELTRKFR